MTRPDRRAAPTSPALLQHGVIEPTVSSDMRQRDDDSRRDRFIKKAISILAETGRMDFTVQELVERSRTSLRSFYQHFATKDELLVALFEEIMGHAGQTWRRETDALTATAALRLVIDRMSAPPESAAQDSINRALTLYNQHLAETRPRDYARVLSPVHRLICDIVERGIAEQIFSQQLNVEITAAIVMQTMLDALRLHSLGAELAGEPVTGDHLHEFCLRSLGSAAGGAATA
jgi:AcrR family transcriptional regulator